MPAETPLWPKALLLGSSVLYGDELRARKTHERRVPAAAERLRAFVLAGVALFPFLLRLAPNLRRDALVCGCFTALGRLRDAALACSTRRPRRWPSRALPVVVCPTRLPRGEADGPRRTRCPA